MRTWSSITRLGVLSTLVVLLALAHASGQQPLIPDGGPLPAGDVARGRYLVESVVMCAECHSTRDRQGDIVPGTRLMGGPLPVSSPSWPRARGAWALRTPRIAGLPGYTDELAMRVLTEGAIGRDGRQLRLPMPRFRMTPDDAADVVAYLRFVGGRR